MSSPASACTSTFANRVAGKQGRLVATKSLSAYRGRVLHSVFGLVHKVVCCFK